MSLTTAEIEAVVRDLRPRLQGGRIERIDQPDRHNLILSVRSGQALYWLLICVRPRFSRLHLLTRRPKAARPAAGFCNMLREHMTGAPVLQLRQVPGDRVVVIESARRDRLMQPHRVALVAELTGGRSNLVLIDEEDEIVGVLAREESARRQLAAGLPYSFPSAPEQLPEQALTSRYCDAADPDDALALSRAIQSDYARMEAEAEIETARSELLRRTKAAIKRIGRRLTGLRADLAAAKDAESLRRKGELLKTVLHLVRPGQSQVVVQDFFEPDAPELVLVIDPALSATDNLAALFKKYRKITASREIVRGRLVDAERELAGLERLQADVGEAVSLASLEELRERAVKAGVVRAPAPEKARAAGEPAGPRVFLSADGMEILVSRNRKQNDRLTFTIARGNDYWMHLVDWPGPHVVVRKPPDKSISQDALLDAAHLAVHFSKIRGADHAEVVYTQCKHVRRVKGAGPGKVNYAQASNLRVRMDPGRLRRLLDRRPSS